MFFLQEGFTYRNFLMDMIAVFAFVVWFWLLVVIYGDLFRRCGVKTSCSGLSVHSQSQC